MELKILNKQGSAIATPLSARTMSTLKNKADLKSKKRTDKKNELAYSALQALAHLGYARAGLRDIAALSGVSLGVIHYYFEDKNALVAYAINLYKSNFVAGISSVLEGASGEVEVIDAIIDSLAESITDQAETHRLWYDFRAQSMFEKSFQPAVQAIEEALVDLLGQHLNFESEDRPSVLELYIHLDGVFGYYILRKLMQDENWQPAFRTAMRNVLERKFN